MLFFEAQRQALNKVSSGNIPDRQALHVKACHQALLEMSAQGYELTECRL